MNSKTNIVRAILMDASECERPEADHPATIEISADDLQRILERHITTPAACLHQIAEPAAQGLDAEILDFLAKGYVGPDFRWGDPATEVIVIEMPKGCGYRGDFRTDVTAALAAQAKQGGASCEQN